MPAPKHKEEARESLFAVVGEIGGVWATFDTREKAERYPGPRMLEMAARAIVEYVPASLLSSRDTEIREVLEGLRTYRSGDINYEDTGKTTLHWCNPDKPCTPACLATQRLWSRLQS